MVDEIQVRMLSLMPSLRQRSGSAFSPGAYPGPVCEPVQAHPPLIALVPFQPPAMLRFTWAGIRSGRVFRVQGDLNAVRKEVDESARNLWECPIRMTTCDLAANEGEELWPEN